MKAKEDEMLGLFAVTDVFSCPCSLDRDNHHRLHCSFLYVLFVELYAIHSRQLLKFELYSLLVSIDNPRGSFLCAHTLIPRYS
jgi:hypothetical protein